MANLPSMEVQEACKLIRHWNESFLSRTDLTPQAHGLVEAVAALKRYLEREKCDGKPIHELDVAEHLLATREGIHGIMPFVLSAESMEAWKRRRTAT